MNHQKPNKSRYEQTVYDGEPYTTKTVTYDQVMQINSQSVDHFMSPAFGTFGYRTAEGQWVEHRAGNWPGLGDTSIRIIQALQLNPGEFLTPTQIADITGRPSLRENNVLSARLMAIRKAHKESCKKPHFFLSRRAGGFAVAWNPECSWTWVVRI